MRADTHLMGSARGYGQLAASPGVSDAESAALAGIDIGQPAGGRAERLATRIVAVCRVLPSGRVALTRCVAGELDDAGRATIEFRSIVMDAHDWLFPIRSGIQQLVTSNAIWNDPAFAQGQPVEWSVVEAGVEASSRDAAAVGRMIARQPRPVLLKTNTRHDAATLHFVATGDEQVIRGLQWGVGLARPCSGLDVATLTGGARGGYAPGMLDHAAASTEPAHPSLPGPVAPSRGIDPQPTRSIWWIAACSAIVLCGGLWWALATENAEPAAAPPAKVQPAHVVAVAELAEVAPPSIGVPVTPPQHDATTPTQVDPPEPPATQTPPPPGPPESAGSVSEPSHDDEAEEIDKVEEVASIGSEPAPDMPADPTAAYEFLDDWHEDVLLMLVPQDVRPGGVANAAVLIRRAEDVLRPLRSDEENYGDGVDYLCVLSEAAASLDDIAAIATTDALRHWGAVQATARWLSSAGRNERAVRRRTEYLKRCIAELRRIAQIVEAFDAVVQHEVRPVMDRIDQRGLAHFVGSDPEVLALYETCLMPIRELLEQDLIARWPVAAATPMLLESCAHLKPYRDTQPDGDQ